MIKSMTGYGRAQGETSLGDVQIEMRGVNNKHLDLKLRLPRYLNALETNIQGVIRSRISRGRIDLNLKINNASAQSVNLRVNEPVAEAYLAVARKLQANFKLDSSLSAESILRLPEVINLDDPEVDEENFWNELKPVLESALDYFCAMRDTEGEQLSAELEERLDIMRGLVAQVDEHRKEAVQAYQERLEEKLKELFDKFPVDEARLAQEVALLAERSDITEEVVRLKSHLEQFGALITSGQPAGRQMDFLLQEMIREVNTIGSKVELLVIKQRVIDMKTEVDKMREQAMNVE